MSQRQGAMQALPYGGELQEALCEALQDGQGDYQLGVSAAVRAPGYNAWQGVCGQSQPGVPITSEMVFDAGSVTKNFEGALALKLSEEGALGLDDLVSRWLPAYPNVDSRTTVRQLLNHTSGIFNVFEHPKFPWARNGIDYTKKWETAEVFARFVREPYGPPGEVQYYSSTNYLLLTAILEKAAGASVPKEVKRRFLEPLELRHTALTQGEPLPRVLSVAHPWADLDRDGKLEDLVGIPVTWIASLTHPAVFTTPADLTRWLRALYGEGSVLAPNSLAEMLTLPETAVRDPEGGRYGLGVVDYSGRLGMRIIGHGGSALGYSAAAFYLPEYGLAVAWLVNTGEAPPELAGAIMGEIWSALSRVFRRNLRSGGNDRPRAD